MTRFGFTYFLGIAILCILTSCNHGYVFDKSESFKDKSWHMDQEVEFVVNIADTTSANTLFVNLRHDKNYGYSNLYLFFSIQSPAGDVKKDTLNLILAAPNGRWLGKGIGGSYAYQIPVYQYVKFTEPGEYTFTLVQGTRDEELMHIMDIGISLEKIK